MGSGILVDIEWCTGCHSCEIACQIINNLSPHQFGIKVTQIGPWQGEDGAWVFLNAPTITRLCNFCEERVELGMEPMCVKHCQSQCLSFGSIEQLIEELKQKPRAVLLSGDQTAPLRDAGSWCEPSDLHDSDEGQPFVICEKSLPLVDLLDKMAMAYAVKIRAGNP